MATIGPTSTVYDLVNGAQTYTGELVTAAKAAMESATTAAQIFVTFPEYAKASFPDKPPTSISSTLPTMVDATFVEPDAPTSELIFQDIADLDNGEAPVLDAVSPEITLPDGPSQLTEFMTVMPEVETKFDFPMPPDELHAPIDFPLINTRTEPHKPVIGLPTFDATKPADIGAAPTDYERRFEAAYKSAAPATMTLVSGYVDAMLNKYNPQYTGAMAAIETQLEKYLAGGTALAPEVEAAIFARAQERNDREASRLSDAIYNESAARGFTIPNGAINSQIQHARQDATNNNNKTTNEIIVMQAEMEQKNLQFAVTTSAGLRLSLIHI